MDHKDALGGSPIAPRPPRQRHTGPIAFYMHGGCAYIFVFFTMI